MFDLSFILKESPWEKKYLACLQVQLGNQNTCKRELQFPYWHADSVQMEGRSWSRSATCIHLSLCVCNLCWRCEITCTLQETKDKPVKHTQLQQCEWISGSPGDNLRRQRSLGFSTIPQSKMVSQRNSATREGWGLKASNQSWQGCRKRSNELHQ